MTYKDNILGNDTWPSYMDHLEEINSLIKVSADRDIAYWGNEYFTLGGEVSPVRRGFPSKFAWMDSQIGAL